MSFSQASLKTHALPLLGALAALLATGCGGDFPIASVSGTVTLDNRPFTTGQVMFTPVAKAGETLAGPAAIGPLDGEGRFTLGAYSERDGAVVGPNRVTVINTAGKSGAKFDRILLPQAPLEVVAGQKNEFKIELTSEMIARYATK